MHNSIMKTIIVPLITNKTGDINDKNNYRPIALVTAASKIFELAMLDLIEHNIKTSCNQFGFNKRKHATDICIYSLKIVQNIIDIQIVRYFHVISTPPRHLTT